MSRLRINVRFALGITAALFTGAGDAYTLGSGTEYHVKKTGNDTTGTGTDALPFLTIKRGLEAATTAGDIVTAHASAPTTETLYAEVGNYVVSDTTYAAVLRVLGSGTADNRNTLRANPGDEGYVVIDCGSTKGGIDFNFEDHFQLYGIRFRNVVHSAIYAPDNENLNLDITQHSTGCLIENNYIEDCTDPTASYAVNSAPMRVFGLKDSTIRNNKVRSTDIYTHGIMTYGWNNVIVEFNDVDVILQAIYQKGFWYPTASTGSVDGAEIRFNKLKAVDAIRIEGASSLAAPAGLNWIHNNILIPTTGYALFYNLRDALQQSKRLRLNNNTVYSTTSGSFADIACSNDIESYGNIAANCSTIYRIRGSETNTSGNDTFLKESDYNVFEWSDTYFGIMDLYDAAQEDFTGVSAFTNWKAQTQALTATGSLKVDNPDTNSLTDTTANLFIDLVDFKNKTGSNAIGLLTNGDNAGCWENAGVTYVGLNASYSAG